MKIKEVKFIKHNIFGELKLDFSNPNTIESETLNLIVLAGINGTGKTTIFNGIYKIFEKISEDKTQKRFLLETALTTSLPNDEAYDRTKFVDLWGENSFLKLDFSDTIEFSDDENKEDENRPRLIYITAEVDFPEIKNKNFETIFTYNLYQKINAEVVKDIPAYVSNQIMQSAYIEEDVSLKKIRDRVFKEINDIFNILELDIKMVGMSPSNFLPIFEKNGVTFDINKLSSGEKQLFLRMLSIKMLKINNSIILIDEPEISLHPIWQQKILKVYEKIGINNQIIIATHSPFILGGTKSENIRLLYRENGEIKVKNEMGNIYGKPVQKVLEDLMGLTSVRDPEINNQLEELKNLVKENKFNTMEFKNLRESLGNILGLDSDLILIDMEIERRENIDKI